MKFYFIDIFYSKISTLKYSWTTVGNGTQVKPVF